MKNVGKAIAWGYKLASRFPQNLISSLIRRRNPVQKGRVVCWSYEFKQYSCNPKALTGYLLNNHPEYEIIWVFRKGVDTRGIDSRIKCVTFRSMEYLRAINTAEFLITNCRTHPYNIGWKKRPGQKYLMLWHAGMALKKIEKDVEDKLGYQYPIRAKADSKVCDLMISGCGFHTTLAKEKFWYDGQVLECGIPRNDILFDRQAHAEIKRRVAEAFDIPQDSKIVLYAPTFRKPATIEPYMIDWSMVIPAIQKALGSEKVKVLLRLHPNLIGRFDISSLLGSTDVIDVTLYHDMHELLCASDLLITDYSSSMFDMSLLERPCILYATDAQQYDRGYYFHLDQLPYPLAQSQEELIRILESFNQEHLMEEYRKFDKEHIKSVEKGQASAGIARWMKEHSI